MNSALWITGARVWTGDTEAPFAESFLVENGVFRAVGSEQHVNSAVESFGNVEKIDAGGSLIVPGITDAHMHLTAYCKQNLYLDLSDVKSIEELLSRLQGYIEKHPEYRWVRAVNFNETLWENPISPTIEMLDSVDCGKAVIVSRYCGHVHAANKRAIEESGLCDSTDGNVVRNADGKPNGILNENAAAPILEYVEKEHESPEALRALLYEGCKRLSSLGITAVHACDVPSYGLPENLELFQDLYDKDELPVRIVSYHDELPNLSFRSGFGNPFISYGGFKIFIDGNLGGFTAALREDFSDKPGCRGQLTHTDSELFEMLKEAQAKDIQVQIHMIGDSAIDQAIRVSQDLMRISGKKPRFPMRFNHVIVCHPDQIAAMKELAVILDTQPIQVFTDRNMAPSRLGKERMGSTYPFRRFYDSGIFMTGSSDAPMETSSPWAGIWAAVCRTDEDGVPLKNAKMDETLTVQEALELYTKNPYKAIGRGEGYGKIARGARADFAILDRDIFKCDKRSIKDTRASSTYLEGRKVHG